MIGVGAFLIGAAGTVFATGALVPKASDPERAKIEAVVRDYILANPEIIPQAMEKLRAKETASAVAAQRATLETPFASAWAGAERGDATLVVFYDYACGFCRKSLPDIDRLLREDKNLKIVFRELPILSEDSERAALVSLAAARAGKFKPFHDALFATARPTPENVAAAQAKAGTGAAAIDEAAFRSEIDANIEAARALGFTGTPSWVVGDQVLNGAVGYEALKAAIAAARAGG